MPVSAMSRPASSSSAVTRSPIVCLIAKNDRVRHDEHARERVPTPSAWAPSWWKLPLYQRPRVADTVSSASRGDVNRPQESVPQMPARPCADSAPTGSSSTFSIMITP